VKFENVELNDTLYAARGSYRATIEHLWSQQSMQQLRPSEITVLSVHIIIPYQPRTHKPTIITLASIF